MTPRPETLEQAILTARMVGLSEAEAREWVGVAGKLTAKRQDELMAKALQKSPSWAKQFRLMLARRPDLERRIKAGKLDASEALAIDRRDRRRARPSGKATLTISVRPEVDTFLRIVARERGCSLGAVVELLHDMAPED